MLQTDAPVRSPNATTSNAREKIRVMLVDDSMILLDDTVAFLQEYPEIELVGTICSTKNAVAQADLCAPDIVLLDVTTSGMGGLAIIAELHAFKPALPVIVLDMISMESVQRAARAIGAAICITKVMATTSLVPAIRALCQSDKFNA